MSTFCDITVGADKRRHVRFYGDLDDSSEAPDHYAYTWREWLDKLCEDFEITLQEAMCTPMDEVARRWSTDDWDDES